MINDTELGIDESMSESNWRIWLETVYTSVFDYLFDHYGEWHPDITWYVSEYSYKESIDKISKHLGELIKVDTVLMDRNDNPVSGTLCRTQPLKYWNKITEPFRAYYSHNILITGTASEGKTTLVRDIGKYFNLPYSYEKGRDNCAIKTEPEFNVKDYIYNLYEQHRYNESLICSPQNPGVFISDTDNCVTLMYANAHKGQEGFVLSEEDYDLLYSIASTYMKTTKWDKIFLLKPHEKDIVDDGERYMPDSDYSIRLRYYEFLKSLYDKFGYEYEELDGNYYENFCAVKNYVNALYGG